MAKLWTVLQLADSAFPVGGFAHSGGLETTVNWGRISTEEKLVDFIRTSLIQAEHAQLPFVTMSFHHPESFATADHRCDATLNNHVANRASRRQGQALLSTASATFGLVELSKLTHKVRAQKLYAHQAPVFGVVGCSLNLSATETIQVYIFNALRTLISSAVRLNAIGPLRAQAIQHELCDFVEAIVCRSSQTTSEHIAITAPIIEILQGSHDRLYTRLFQS